MFSVGMAHNLQRECTEVAPLTTPFSKAVLLLSILIGGCASPAVAPPASTTVAALSHRALIILESGASPAFAGVAVEIARRWRGPKQVFRLNGDEKHDRKIQNDILHSDISLIAAIGLEASVLAQDMLSKKVVFCQTFNYEDRNLIRPGMAGVSPLPPAREQFRVWKALDPKLKSIAVVTGPRLSSLMTDVRAAARAAHVTIQYREVKSDLEAVFVTTQLLRMTDGVWLLPDNRILSRRSLQEIIAIGHREGKQVAVFGAQLLALGALLSVEAEQADIAAQTVAQLIEVQKTTSTGPVIAPLTRLDFRVNAIVARQLNLRIPPSFKGKIYAP